MEPVASITRRLDLCVIAHLQILIPNIQQVTLPEEPPPNNIGSQRISRTCLIKQNQSIKTEPVVMQKHDHYDDKRRKKVELCRLWLLLLQTHKGYSLHRLKIKEMKSQSF